MNDIIQNPHQPRNTKIVATLGPASESPEILKELILAGVNVVRINFSHGIAQDHIDRVHLVRKIANKVGKEVAVMADLQGPKIRIGLFADKKIMLNKGDTFIFDINCTLGDQFRVGLDYPELVDDVNTGDILLLDDGKMTMKVKSVLNGQIECECLTSGSLSNRKGINRQGGGLLSLIHI
jgi:pyruvate kinase